MHLNTGVRSLPVNYKRSSPQVGASNVVKPLRRVT
jgi:hypothetical protein